MPLDEFYRQITVLQEFDIERETIDIINANSDVIKRLVREQLTIGLTGDGSFTRGKYGAYYTDWTEWNKLRHGKDALARTVGYVTMYMSGRFYNSLKVRASGSEFEVFSDVPYFSTINAWNNNKLVELNQDSLNYFSKVILIPELQRRFNSRFNGI